MVCHVEIYGVQISYLIELYHTYRIVWENGCTIIFRGGRGSSFSLFLIIGLFNINFLYFLSETRKCVFYEIY